MTQRELNMDYDPESKEQEVYQRVQAILNPISEELTDKIGDVIEALYDKYGDKINFSTIIALSKRALDGMEITYNQHMDMLADEEMKEQEEEEGPEFPTAYDNVDESLDFSDN